MKIIDIERIAKLQYVWYKHRLVVRKGMKCSIVHARRTWKHEVDKSARTEFKSKTDEKGKQSWGKGEQHCKMET